MRVEIKRLQQELATTSLYVTHDQVEAMTLADRLIVMNAGNADQIGPPLDLYERPATAFVAGFIGSPAMNLVEGRIDGAGAVVGNSYPAMLPARRRPARRCSSDCGRSIWSWRKTDHCRSSSSCWNGSAPTRSSTAGSAAPRITVALW